MFILIIIYINLRDLLIILLKLSKKIEKKRNRNRHSNIYTKSIINNTINY